MQPQYLLLDTRYNGAMSEYRTYCDKTNWDITMCVELDKTKNPPKNSTDCEFTHTPPIGKKHPFLIHTAINCHKAKPFRAALCHFSTLVSNSEHFCNSMTYSKGNGNSATATAPPAGLLQHCITLVACPASSHENTSVQSEKAHSYIILRWKNNVIKSNSTMFARQYFTMLL